MKSALTVVTGVVILALIVGGSIMVSGMQSDERVVAGEVDLDLQRARRLLLQYDTHLALESGLRDELGGDTFALLEEDSSTESKYRKSLADNNRYLREASKAAANAVRANRSSPEAHKLLGMIQYEEGRLAAQQAAILRDLQSDVRATLGRRAARLGSLQKDLDVVASSKIDDLIAQAGEDADAAREAIEDQQAVVDDLASQVEALQDELDDRKSIADSARAETEGMESDGLDLNDPAGLMEFQKNYREQSQRYRLAMLEAQAIEFGTLENATIDASGDYIDGKYEPILPDEGIGFTRGLIHLQQDLDDAESTLANLETAAELAEQSIADLEAIKAQLSDRATRAEEAVEAEVALIEGTGGGGDDEDEEGDEEAEEDLGEYPMFEDYDIAIREQEDAALDLFDKAAKSFSSAAGAARSEPQPFRGQVAAQQAEAMLAQALVLVGRAQDLRENIRVANALVDYFNNSEAIEEWEATLDDDRVAAEALVTEAIDILQNKAKRDIGGGNWMVATEIGTAHYILELLGVEMSAERALKWYDTALEQVSDQNYAAEHVRTRDFIRRGLESAPQEE